MVWFICYHLCLFFIITRLRAHNFEPHLVQCIYPSDDPIQPCPSRYRFNTASFFVSPVVASRVQRANTDHGLTISVTWWVSQ